MELRERLSVEVRDLLKSEGISGILVTHDQHEAFTSVGQGGRDAVARYCSGTRHTISITRPNHRFVADFIGQGASYQGSCSPRPSIPSLGCCTAIAPVRKATGTRVEILIRPDDLVPDTNGEIEAVVKEQGIQGAEILTHWNYRPERAYYLSFPGHYESSFGDTVRVRMDGTSHLLRPK